MSSPRLRKPRPPPRRCWFGIPALKTGAAHEPSIREQQTRQLALTLEFAPVVPPFSTRAEPWEYDWELYKRRNEIERLFRYHRPSTIRKADSSRRRSRHQVWSMWLHGRLLRRTGYRAAHSWVLGVINMPASGLTSVVLGYGGHRLTLTMFRTSVT